LGRQTQQHDRLRGQRDWILATPEIQHILVGSRAGPMTATKPGCTSHWRRRSCLRRWLRCP